MSTMFATTQDRDRAAELRGLLGRLDSGEGEDRELGADIVNALEASPLVGDPTSVFSSAFRLALFLKQDGLNTLRSTTQRLRDRVLIEGWKRRDHLTEADCARLMTTIVLTVHLARLEASPA